VQRRSPWLSASAVFRARSALRRGGFEVSACAYQGWVFDASIMGVHECIDLLDTRIAQMRESQVINGRGMKPFQMSVCALD
jgi:hypothetical protein